MGQETEHFYEFGPFHLDAADGLLCRDGKPVPLPPKAIDTLLVLVERGGHVVHKDDLMKAVWPDTFVEEANLTQNISLLRKALGDGTETPTYIETIPRRGYRFVAAVRSCGEGPSLVVLTERTRTHIVLEQTNGGAAPALTARALPAPSAWLARRRWAALVVAALVLALGGVVYRYLVGRPDLPFEKRDWVLVLDFENQTGEPRFDRALVTAFTVTLEQSQYANIYSRGRLGPVLKRMGRSGDAIVDEGLGFEIARREGIRALVACSIARAGQQYALTARLVDPNRQVAVRSFTERVAGEDGLLDALDRLAGGVRRSLGESLHQISRASRPLPQVTTSSLEGLQAYTDGGEAWRKGKYQEAVALYRRAIELDPQFAMAYAALGSAYFSHIITQPDAGRQHFEKALALTDRISDRERGRIQADFQFNLGHYAEALTLQNAHLKIYPDDWVVLQSRALLLMRMRRCEDSIAAYQEVLRVNPANPNALINIATCYRSLDRHKEALPFYEKAFALEPDWIRLANLNHEYGFGLVGVGQPEKAREVFGLALAKPDSRYRALRSLALLDMYQGKYREAAGKLREALRAESGDYYGLSRAREHLILSLVLEGQGDRGEQWRELELASRDLDATRPVLWMKFRVAAVFARAGAVGKASQMLEQNRAQVDRQSAEQQSDLHRLEGEIALARGDFSQAIQRLESAHQENPTPLTAESVACAYRMAGRRDEAIAAYESFLAMPGWIGWEPQQAWLAAHYHLAELYVARGEREKAKKLLDRLLDLWKDADGDLPLLKKALKLRGEIP